MEVFLIESTDAFHKYYKSFKNSSKNNSIPEIFIVGLDIETICQDNQKESFSRSLDWVEKNGNKIAACTIQIANSSMCLIINLIKFRKDIPKKLIEILTKDCWVKLGVGIERDLEILSYNFNLGHCSGAIELKNIALMANYKKSNLEFLFQTLIGPYSKENHSFTDWSKELNSDLINYAARDAIMSYQIGKKILEPSVKLLETKTPVSITDSVLKININCEVNRDTKENVNWIGKLNEFCQKNKLFVEYTEMVSSSTNSNSFNVTCSVGNISEVGTSYKKQEAKQAAAEKVYLKLT